MTKTRLTPFSSRLTISNMLLSGHIKFKSKKGIARVTLIDKNDNEYLIYENSYFMADTDYVELNNEYFETGYLGQKIPKSIEIFTSDASIYIDGLNYNKQLDSTYSKITNIKSKLLENKHTNNISKINSYIKKNNQKWIAGETPFSKLTYQDKKHYFGDTVPNLYGAEYYRGGLFELPDNTSTSSGTTSSSSSIYGTNTEADFDWRNRHGMNWNSPVKDQGGCNSCYIFGTVGAIEGLVNLYYNRLINLDLSEQNLLSCTNGSQSNCSYGGVPRTPVRYIISHGVVNETCFSYSATDETCSNVCDSPTERIKISNYQVFNYGNYSAPVTLLKKFIVSDGILIASICDWKHCMALVGFGTVKAGTVYYPGDSLLGYTTPITIQPGDSRIGKTFWIFKNSWGGAWGMSGYLYLIANMNEFSGAYSDIIPMSPVASLNYAESDRVCVDMDGDGYYNWGIGTKPATCPDCAPLLEDGNDADATTGPINEIGTPILPFTPITQAVTNVTSSTTWSRTTMVCSDLDIKNNSTLTVSSIPILMQASHTIYVESGSTLTINGGKTSLAGIEVKAGGTLNLINSGVIELVNPASLTIDLGGVFNQSTGSLVNIVNPFAAK